MQYNNYPILWLLFGMFMLSYVIPFGVTLFRLLRFDIGRVKMTRQVPPQPLSEVHKAAADEIAALGFEQIAAYTTNDGYDTFPSLLFRHRELPAFASIDLRANPFAGYPVSFWSFARDGKIWLTVNRQPTSQEMPDTVQSDPYAVTLPLHWQAHEARIKGADLMALDSEAACTRMIWASENYPDHNLAAGKFIQLPEGLFFSFRTALAMTMAAMRKRKLLRLPYKSVMTADANRAGYYAELYQAYEEGKKRLRHRRGVVFFMLALSGAVSFGLFTWLLGWLAAAAVIVVLFVHECGHAIAMRFFGYRDVSMFFIPLLGAVATGNIKNISVWRQMIVLLAGPVPGLIFGIFVLRHMHDFPQGGFVQLLGINAAIINLFNLLPFSFLDGGKLIEIAFLSRWPYAVFGFALVSCLAMVGLIVWTKSNSLWIIAMVMAMSARALWRIARIKSEWERAPAQETRSLKELFDFVGARSPSKAFPRQYFIVKQIYEKPPVSPPRMWETVLVLSLFLAFWGSSGAVAWSVWHH